MRSNHSNIQDRSFVNINNIKEHNKQIGHKKVIYHKHKLCMIEHSTNRNYIVSATS